MTRRPIVLVALFTVLAIVLGALAATAAAPAQKGPAPKNAPSGKDAKGDNAKGKRSPKAGGKTGGKKAGNKKASAKKSAPAGNSAGDDEDDSSKDQDKKSPEEKSREAMMKANEDGKKLKDMWSPDPNEHPQKDRLQELDDIDQQLGEPAPVREIPDLEGAMPGTFAEESQEMRAQLSPDRPPAARNEGPPSQESRRVRETDATVLRKHAAKPPVLLGQPKVKRKPAAKVSEHEE